MHGAAAKREGRSPAPWSIVAAAVWMLFFTGLALTLELPNNRPLDRWDLLSLAPGLVDLIDPPPIEAGDSPQAQLVRDRSGWRYFPQRLDPIAVAVLILAGAWGLGHLLLRAIRLPLQVWSLERNVFAFGVGLSCQSLLTLLAGLVGVLSRPLLGSIIVAAILAECALQFLPPFRKGAGSVVGRTRSSSIATAPTPPFLRGGGNLRWLCWRWSSAMTGTREHWLANAC